MQSAKFTDDRIEPHRELLENAIAATHAERGLIVLRDLATNQPVDFPVIYHFEQLPYPTPKPEPPDHEYDEAQYLWDMMTDFMTQSIPIISHNADANHYYARNINMIGWSLRSILAVPLQQQGAPYGLLWCDQRMKNGVFSADDLALVVALVEQFQA